MATADTCLSSAPYFTARPGRLEAFKVLCNRLVEATSAEPGCLYCGFSFDGDQAHCREGYRDAGAWLDHLENVGAIFGEMLEVADLTRLEIHGAEHELAKIRKPVADMGLNARLFTLEYGFRG
jgi:quinol monooxygenase YgiN